ncbi:MAG TPA: hypothetical protein VEW46_15120 [Pyrinomonadaceae bacterium]|nr:hypothetical protein [Pyrinomonadaceae bacterium]
MNDNSYSDIHIHSQQRATRALIKFCSDHDYDYPAIPDLHHCLRALEQGNIKAAVEFYQKVPLGGMGCFNDWLPPVIFSHENPEYVQAVFEALTSQWSLLMRLSLPKTN